jgi:hypothetical protein
VCVREREGGGGGEEEYIIKVQVTGVVITWD